MFEQALNMSMYMTITFVLYYVLCFWYAATIELMQPGYLPTEKSHNR